MASAARYDVTIRPAREDEVGVVLGFIRELAVYEHLEHQVVATEDGLRQSLFGPRPYAEVVLACVQGEPVGFALFFHNFSTFLGRPGIYLEDLFVRPQHRGKGIGKALMIHLARQCEVHGCMNLQWAGLDWNTPSIDFYKSLGAVPKDEWTICRLSGDALARLAERA